MIDIQPFWYLRDKIEIVNIPPNYKFTDTIFYGLNGFINFPEMYGRNIIVEHDTENKCSYLVDYNINYTYHNVIPFCTYQTFNNANCVCLPRNIKSSIAEYDYPELLSPLLRIIGCTKLFDEKWGHDIIIGRYELQEIKPVILFKLK